MTLLLVMLGGAAGAVARFLVNQAASRHTVSALPYGTLTVNVAGSLLLGLLAGIGSDLPGWLGALLGTGFCGALTTYSTFSLETLRLAATGAAGRVRALLNVGCTLGLGLGAAHLGRLLTG